MDYVSPNTGTNKLVQWLNINQNPDPKYSSPQATTERVINTAIGSRFCDHGVQGS